MKITKTKKNSGIPGEVDLSDMMKDSVATGAFENREY